jgi:small subunit ribosomal protein S9
MILASGKRKRAVARAMIKSGSGKVLINKMEYKNLHIFDKLKIDEPLRITKEVIGNNDFDITITVKGGGEKGQIEAARVALTRAISKYVDSKELTRTFIAYDRNLIVADVRRKEQRKPGDSKARKKRQKSFR